MLKTHFEKLSHAIKHGRTREIGEAFKELRKARAAGARISAATVKLTSVYDSGSDCLESFHTLDIQRAEACLGLVANAVIAPDGETLLHASGQLLDPSKGNKCVSGGSVSRRLADRYDGQFVTVSMFALALDASGSVALIEAEAQVPINAHRPGE